MGAWGVSIFSDDLAIDVKDDYQDYTYFFTEEKEITGKLIENYKESLRLDEERPVFWYALAICQWKTGRLEEEVKKQALYYIDHPENDMNLQLWKNLAETTEDVKEKKVYADLYQERKKVLQKLKSKLNSPMPAIKPRKIKTGKPALFETGDIVRVELDNKAFQRFRRSEKFLSEDQMGKIEKLFEDNHFYMIKIGERKDLIDSMFLGKENDEKYVKYSEKYCLFDWIGKEELSSEQISMLPIAGIPKVGRDGSVIEDSDIRECKVFALSNYNLTYPDIYSYYEGRYMKVSQLKKVYNDKTLIPQVKNEISYDELLRKAIVYFALLK